MSASTQLGGASTQLGGASTQLGGASTQLGGASTQVAEALAAGGAPPQLAPDVIAALGPTAAAELGDDPWRLLAVPGVRPEQADAYARARLGPRAHPDDARRARALVGWLLGRAARDGHSALHATTVCRALPAFGFADAE